MNCPSCTFENPPGMRFCGQCGAQLPSVCGNCGTESPPGFKFCGNCGQSFTEPATAPRPEPPASQEEPLAIAAEHRQLTVMFCDLVGSTALSERLDPEALRQVVLDYQQVSTQVVDRFEGHVAQLLGDGILVYFGYPSAHEDDPRRAVHAALGIVEAIADLNRDAPFGDNIDLSVRLGIHTGPVVTGDLGGTGRREQLAVGQTPNIAARLQGLAEPNGIVLSASTHGLVEGLFDFRSLGPSKLKGVSEPVEIYEVLAETGVPERFQAAVRKGLPPLVGRRDEMALLARKLEEARGGEPRLVILTGEAGFGKSRLAYELKENQADDTLTWWTCYCSAYHANSALHPLIELVQRLFELGRKDSPDLKISKLEQGLTARGAHLPEVLPLFASLLSLPLPETYEPSVYSPQRERERILELLQQEILGHAAQKPTIFVVENLQWADPSTLQFLELLLAASSGEMLLTLMTRRPEFELPWSLRPKDAEIIVDRLSEEQIIDVTRHWTRGKSLPPLVQRQILEKTDGVPLFVEELTKTILESGLLVEGESAFELAGPLKPLEIPSTLQDSLRARLDRLPPRVKETAQVGSVIGRKFSYDLIDMIAPQPSNDIEQALDHLIKAEMLLHGGSLPIATFRFKHVLIQETTYGSLLKRLRKLYHQQIAEALEKHFPDICQSDPEMLAHHFTEAGNPERGLDYWLMAGQRAFQQSAIVEAQAHLDRGLQLLESLPEGVERDRRELTLQAVLGAALSTVRGFAAPEVNQAFGRAFEICQRSEDAPELFWVMWGLWRFHFVRANLEKAMDLAQRLTRLAEPRQDAAVRIAAYFTVGATLFCYGDPVAAHAYLEKAIDLDWAQRSEHYAAQTGEDSGVASRIWDAWCLWFMGQPEAAHQRADEAVALARRVSHPFSLTYALAGGCFLAYYNRRPASVHEQTQEVLTQSLEQGTWWAIPAPIFLGWAGALLPGDEDVESAVSGREAMESIRQAIEGHQATGARLHRTQYLVMLAEAAARQNQVDEARARLDDALAAASKTSETFFEPEIHRLRAELELRTAPDRETAEEVATPHFRRALELARGQASKSLELRAALGLAHLHSDAGEPSEARELLERALRGFAKEAETADLEAARRLLDDLSRGSSSA